ncbi:hypothetical protein [Kribbella sp. NPDC000426]|uniref:hypothetical protein n=1 Tax=Kribbella sp. NPDC000426 TaxID=3154255 RepID=UPI0033343A90
MGNQALLFLLSLFPSTTAWMDETRFAQTPVVTYGLTPRRRRCVLRPPDDDHPPTGAGVGIALACFVAAAIIWIAPDRRIDRLLRNYQPTG